MHSHRIRSILGVVIPVIAAAGCRKTPPSTPQPTSGNPGLSASATSLDGTSAPKAAQAITSASAAASAWSERPKHHHRAGLGGVLFGALGEIHLTEEQNAKLSELERRHEPDDDSALRHFRADLASAAKANQVAPTQLKADYQALDALFASANDKHADAINSLHEILTPYQRRSLTAAIRKRTTEREAQPLPDKTEGSATPLGTARAGAPEKASGQSAVSSNESSAAGLAQLALDRLTKRLDLNPDQQKRIGLLLTKHAPPPPSVARDEFKKRIEAVLTAFETDQFDARKLSSTAISARNPREPFQHLAAFVTETLPVLLPEQRENFAFELGRENRPFPGHARAAGPEGSARHQHSHEGHREGSAPNDRVGLPFDRAIEQVEQDYLDRVHEGLGFSP